LYKRSYLIYVICVCLRIVVSNTYLRVFYKRQELLGRRGRLDTRQILINYIW
jgi:hypothetical protein